jgi:MoaA/NifB/PqqE/SkfB family radical SAM enzyme
MTLLPKLADQSDPAPENSPPPASQGKLWLYTNFDCNLNCTYCVAESTPTAPRRALGLANVKRLVDEAVTLDFSDLFLTGGEPFILPDIYDMLAYASARLRTTRHTPERQTAGKVTSHRQR